MKTFKFWRIIYISIFSLCIIIQGCINNNSAKKVCTKQSANATKVKWEIGKVPSKLELPAFYKKYVYVNGIHVMSSHKVADSVLIQACNIILFLTEAIPPKILQELTKRNCRVAVMSTIEGTTDIPEHADLAKDTAINWDVRARGLGGEINLPLTTCAEENLMCYQLDKYHAEDILIHEFAHTIHNIGILPLYPNFNTRLKNALDQAVKKGKWLKTYAKTDVWEYFAEGVQDWFNVNGEVPVPDGKHNHVNTRKELKEYDPVLYNILKEFFSETTQTVSCHAVSYE